MPLVSITICVRDGEQWIDDCLSALIAQTHRPLEIIAVDDGSSDGGTERLLNWAGEHEGVLVTVLTQSALGLSAARNKALGESKGEWVAITDIDCRPDPYWIEELLRVSDGIGGEHVLAITGRTVFAEGKTPTSRMRAREIARKYASRSRLASLANGPCSIFDRASLEDIGGFDPSWYHAEDMEVSLRLLATGGVIIHTPAAVVHHVAESSLRLFLRKRRRDARAHMRIRRSFGRQGVRKPDGSLHRHDFISDATDVLPMLPIVLIGLGFAVTLVLWLPAESMFWWVAIATSVAWGLLIASRWRRLLWSCALWMGACDGMLDALLGRHGHPRLFARRP